MASVSVTLSKVRPKKFLLILRTANNKQMTPTASTGPRGKALPWSRPHLVFEIHISIPSQKEGNDSHVPPPTSTDQGGVSIKAVLDVDIAAVFPHPLPHLTQVILIGCLADGLRRGKQKQVLKYRNN